ncbi:hypothetical protein M0Q97_08100 [Candidatus Dojkabacteria bacterium]|jgi:hypothetical protein|nr:hypothetical protein [Candidatus Dojkabacteria bacterium]
MALRTNNITDNIQDSGTFNNLTVPEQQVVELLKKSMLEIFPIKTDNTIDLISSQYAENFAYKNLEALKLLFNSMIDERLNTIQEQLNTLLTQIEG